MIEHQKQKYNWEFLFLGANIDAEQVAGGIGIGRERAANFAASAEGVQYTFDSVAKAVCMMRAGETVSEEWKAGEKKALPSVRGTGENSSVDGMPEKRQIKK